MKKDISILQHVFIIFMSSTGIVLSLVEHPILGFIVAVFSMLIPFLMVNENFYKVRQILFRETPYCIGCRYPKGEKFNIGKEMPCNGGNGEKTEYLALYFICEDCLRSVSEEAYSETGEDRNIPAKYYELVENLGYVTGK